jgi:glycosyltransferase involved in cell wall biosynthesis
MPLRDDWDSAAELIRQLERVTSSAACILEVVVVDDGSKTPPNAAQFNMPFSAIQRVRVLSLRRNLGHQRAIAIGLVHVYKAISCDAVLVMDSDGEDTADGALSLIQHFSGTSAIFAERSRRTESFRFRLFYRVYKLIHYWLTGITVRVGNFSILPSRYLRSLAITSELWNHYAASIFRSGLPFQMIPIPRGYRIAGKSKMNFVSLAAHGLSAISVFGDVVGVRLLIAAMFGAAITSAALVVVICVRTFTALAIPGWATYAAGILAILLIQFIGLAVTFTFTTLSGRANLTFVPAREYEHFVAEVRDLYSYD